MSRRLLHHLVSDGNHRPRFVTALALVLGASSCASDSIAPPVRPTTPQLEAVDFRALSSGKVMFQRFGGGHGGVYVIDADAQRVAIALDTVESLVWAPSIAPGGNQVAWLRWTVAAGTYDVYRTDISGGSPMRLSTYAGNAEGSPSWTPTGSAVVFLVSSLQDWGIHQYEVASGSLATVRAFSLGTGGTVDCPNTMSPWTWYNGLVSVSSRGGVAWPCGAAIYGAMSPSDAMRLLYSPASRDDRVYATAWSADGLRLALLEVHHTDFPARLAFTSTTVKLLDVTAGTLSTLASVAGSGDALYHSFNPLSLCWLWSANRLVFNAPGHTAGAVAAPASLYVVGANGSGLVRLTTAPDVFDHSVSCSG